MELLLQLGTTEGKQLLFESAHKQELTEHSSDSPQRERGSDFPPELWVQLPRAQSDGRAALIQTSHLWLTMANIQPKQRLQVLLSIHPEAFQARFSSASKESNCIQSCKNSNKMLIITNR